LEDHGLIKGIRVTNRYD